MSNFLGDKLPKKLLDIHSIISTQLDMSLFDRYLSNRGQNMALANFLIDVCQNIPRFREFHRIS